MQWWLSSILTTKLATWRTHQRPGGRGRSRATSVASASTDVSRCVAHNESTYPCSIPRGFPGSHWTHLRQTGATETIAQVRSKSALSTCSHASQPITLHSYSLVARWMASFICNVRDKAVCILRMNGIGINMIHLPSAYGSSLTHSRNWRSTGAAAAAAHEGPLRTIGRRVHCVGTRPNESENMASHQIASPPLSVQWRVNHPNANRIDL